MQNKCPILAAGTQLPSCSIFIGSLLDFGYIDAFNKPASYSTNNLLQLYKFKAYNGTLASPRGHLIYIYRLFQNNTDIFESKDVLAVKRMKE
jgi:hypothetical protein